jgi:hypothetical protein
MFADIPFTAMLPAPNLTRGRGGAARRYAEIGAVTLVAHVDSGKMPTAFDSVGRDRNENRTSMNRVCAIQTRARGDVDAGECDGDEARNGQEDIP